MLPKTVLCGIRFREVIIFCTEQINKVENLGHNLCSFLLNKMLFYIYLNTNNVIMKTLIQIAIIFCLLLFTIVSSFAQTSQKEHHHLLSLHHKKAQDDHHNVALHKTSTAEFRRKEAIDAGMSISAARATHHDMLKTDTPEKSKVIRKHHRKLSSYHKEAVKHNAALSRQLAKPDPDEKKVQAHIDAVNRSLDNAEQENQSLLNDSALK